MKHNGIDSELRARIDAFTADLSILVRQAALETARAALEVAPAAPATLRRGPGRPPKAAAGAPASKPARRGPRAKRTPEDVAKMGEAVVAYVAKNPGQSVDQIARALGAKNKELTLPISRMLDEKRIKKTGLKRGTKYFPK